MIKVKPFKCESIADAKTSFNTIEKILLGMNQATEDFPTSKFLPTKNQQVLFDNSGALGGTSNYIWDNVTNRLTVTGAIRVPYTATGVERYVISAFANFGREFGFYIEANGDEGGFKANSQFTLKAGGIICSTGSANTSIQSLNTTASWIGATSAPHLYLGNVGHVTYSRGAFVVGSSTNSSDVATVRLEVNGPIFNPDNSLEIRRGANAQRLNIYGTFTDASNYRRAFISATTGGAFTLGVEGLGTGASGNTLTLASHRPASMTDAAAANDTIYYSTTASRLAYKDAGGTVNNLY